MKKTILAILVSAGVAASSYAQTLSEFGSLSFTMGTPFDFTANQTSNSLGFSGSDGTNSWAGTFNTPISLSAPQSALLAFSTSQATSRTTPFTIYLVNSTTSLINAFDGSYSGVGSTQQNVALTFNTSVSTNPTFTPGTFDSFQLSFNEGGTAANINATAYNLNVVPEPSTYALMALGGLALFFIARRRMVQA
jgi:hypothetical protein